MNVKDNVAVVTGGASGIGLGRCSVVAFVGRARRQRTITKQQVFARDHDLVSPSAERNRPETQREKAGER